MRLLFVLTLTGAVIVGSVSAQAPKDDKKLKVEIAKEKLSINGKELAVPGDLSDYEKAFGKPSGTIEDPIAKDRKYIYWNSLGICVSQSQKGKKPVQEVQFHLEPMYDLSAKAQAKPFPGELLIDGETINKTTSKDDVKKKLKSGREVFGTWKVEYEGAMFYVNINPGDKGTKSINVEQPLIDR